MIAGLETERLILRPLTFDDVDALVALDGDPEVMRYLTGGRPTPRVVVEETVRSTMEHRWIVLDRTNGEFAGWVSLRPTPHPTPDAAVRELGYRLRRASWGNGFATEAARAVIREAFTNLGVERVWGQTMAVNVASRRVMERCGLRFVRTVHLDWPDPIAGTEHGEVEYELRNFDYHPDDLGPVTQR